MKSFASSLLSLWKQLGLNQRVSLVVAAIAVAGALAAVVIAEGLGCEELCRYARGSDAKRVYLTAGYSPEVAAALAAHRIACEPLGPPQQLALFAERVVPAPV